MKLTGRIEESETRKRKKHLIRYWIIYSQVKSDNGIKGSGLNHLMLFWLVMKEQHNALVLFSLQQYMNVAISTAATTTTRIKYIYLSISHLISWVKFILQMAYMGQMLCFFILPLFSFFPLCFGINCLHMQRCWSWEKQTKKVATCTSFQNMTSHPCHNRR